MINCLKILLKHNYKIIKFTQKDSNTIPPKLPMDKQPDNNDFQIFLPLPTVQLSQIFNQLKLFSKQRLDTGEQDVQEMGNQAEIKGLKFISAKLAKLFFKNRTLPYNEISKILIDNFAAQQKDQRNIKRRVYDAINVLVAAGILIKKNNSIQMIKNKVKAKIQHNRKDKIEQQIKQKQQALQRKHQQQNILIAKHKMIKKLFERNIKNQNNNLKQSYRNSDDRIDMKSSFKKRSRKDVQQQVQSNALVSSHKLAQNAIYEPRLFIFTTDHQHPNKIKNSIIKKFQTDNSIEVLVPYKGRGKSYPIQQMLNFIHNTENRPSLKSSEIKIEEQNIKKQMIDQDQNQPNQPHQFMTEIGVYSLLDLLKLLSLGQLHDQ